MAKALPFIIGATQIIGTGAQAYGATRTKEQQPADAVSLGKINNVGLTNPYIKGSFLSNPYLSVKYKTPEGQLRGK